jgi:hypothetical protein
MANGATREQVILGFVQSAEFQARAGNTIPGFVNLAYLTIMGRAATAGDQAFWQAQANVVGTLPGTLLHTEEYLRLVVNDFTFAYLRHLPNTQVDGSAFFDVNAPYGAQATINFLLNGGDPATVQISLLTSAEYLRLALTGAVWTGDVWNNLAVA